MYRCMIVYYRTSSCSDNRPSFSYADFDFLLPRQDPHLCVSIDLRWRSHCRSIPDRIRKPVNGLWMMERFCPSSLKGLFSLRHRETLSYREVSHLNKYKRRRRTSSSSIHKKCREILDPSQNHRLLRKMPPSIDLQPIWNNTRIFVTVHCLIW